MPNHIKNVWKIKNIPQDKVQYILDKITIVIPSSERIIDFDLIIPQPKLKADCPKDSIRRPDSCSQIDEARPWFDWYEFNTKHWGTKWGAYDGYTKVGKTYIQLVFSTAWSFARPVAYELAKLGYDMECKYADEDYGSNCGIFTYCSHTKEFEESGTLDLRPNAERWARNLWDKY